MMCPSAGPSCWTERVHEAYCIVVTCSLCPELSLSGDLEAKARRPQQRQFCSYVCAALAGHQGTGGMGSTFTVLSWRVKFVPWWSPRRVWPQLHCGTCLWQSTPWDRRGSLAWGFVRNTHCEEWSVRSKTPIISEAQCSKQTCVDFVQIDQPFRSEIAPIGNKSNVNPEFVYKMTNLDKSRSFQLRAPRRRVTTGKQLRWSVTVSIDRNRSLANHL